MFFSKIKKTKLFIINLSVIFLFSGCFSLNPFSNSKNQEKPKKINYSLQLPSEAPKWLKSNKDKGYISSIASVNIKNKNDLDFDKKRALLLAGNLLNTDIYIKTLALYKEFDKKHVNNLLFNKDINKLAEQISLKSVSKSTIKGFWLGYNKLYVKIHTKSEFVANQIQNKSKEIYKVDEILYKNFLSNRAKMKIIDYLEK